MNQSHLPNTHYCQQYGEYRALKFQHFHYDGDDGDDDNNSSM